MALRGESQRALKIGVFASLIGGLISLLILLLFTPVLSKIAIQFGSVEKCLIIIFALSIIAALSKGSMMAGVFAGLCGILVALIGQFTDNNKLRMVPDFLSVDLRQGFTLLPVLVGLFGIEQILEVAETHMKELHVKANLGNSSAQGFHFKDVLSQPVNVIRSALIGTFIGILPGVGGSAASLLSYSQSKTWSKHPEKYGTGIPDGIIGSEASNNGLTGGAMVPLLALGIPGDSTTAVLIGAFMLQGVQVGPLFITNNPALWHNILLALLIGNIFMFLVMFYPIKWIARIIEIPMRRMYPIIILLCVVGSYAASNGSMFDVWTCLIFGVLGFIFKKIKMPTVPFLIGFILGRDLEKYFVDTIKGSGGSLAPFVTHPIGWVIWLLIFASIAFAIWDNQRSKKAGTVNVLKEE
jgi:putative tricarboxylic transport membrane protein